ncbi:MAG: DNA internalization-related competence protein ComEC/Rec2 [Lachnospiraceae bacterium]|nr:DNA internalization-related competence protein ComEC/Rec2 [Lachnospiraceae bacterium]
MRRPLCCVCVAFVVTVFLYLKISPPPEPVHDLPEGERITLLGEVCQKEYKSEYQKNTLVIQLKNVQRWSPDLEQNAEKVKRGNVICYIEADEGLAEPKAGSMVAVEGVVSYFDRAGNPGEFDAQEYYQILGVDFRLYKAGICTESSRYSAYHEILYQLRCHFEGIFDKALAPKDASIMKAVLLGNKSGLDTQSKQLFQKSGIAHILAISGLHITLLGMGLYKLLRKVYIPQSVCAVVSVGLMIAYGDMVGMSSSAYRAVFMFGMQLVAQMLRRTYDMLTALALAAMLILLEQPLYLYHSGFQLSFGAILGVGCLSDVVKPVRRGKRQCLTDKIVLSLCGSLSIFLIHFPIMLCVYYEFPIYSFLLNLVIIPAMTFLMAAGLLCLGVGSLPVVPGLGMAKLVGLMCHALLSLFEWLCVMSLKLPLANWIVGRPEDWRIYAFGAVVIFLYAAHHYGKYLSKGKACEKRGINIGLPLQVRLMTVLAAVILLSDSPVDGVSVTFLDVGQGDCIWIESAKGEHFLVDGGSTSESKVGTYTIIPYLKYKGVAKLDAVFLTHLDSDHISGVMEMLEGNSDDMEIEISRVCISESVIEDAAYEKLAALCDEREIPIYRLKAGDGIEARGLRFEVLHPQGDYETDSRNAYSLVMKLETRDGVTALLTGDVEADGERAASEKLRGIADFAGIDIYKASHHGSRYSNTEELISLIKPELAIISCGEGNSYGHPHTETIEKLEDIGSDIRITKDTGAIMIKIKNGKYEVENFIK